MKTLVFVATQAADDPHLLNLDAFNVQEVRGTSRHTQRQTVSFRGRIYVDLVHVLIDEVIVRDVNDPFGRALRALNEDFLDAGRPSGPAQWRRRHRRSNGRLGRTPAQPVDVLFDPRDRGEELAERRWGIRPGPTRADVRQQG